MKLASKTLYQSKRERLHNKEKEAKGGQRCEKGEPLFAAVVCGVVHQLQKSSHRLLTKLKLDLPGGQHAS